MAEFGTTETRVRRRFDVWNEVPLVPQLTGMSCWAAAAAMVVGWRDRMAADPRQVARGAGSWQAYAGGLRPSDVQTLARAWGLVEERRETWTVGELRRILQRHGPVWLGEASPGLHSIVVTGMHGDGTPDGTWVRVNDPWPVGRGERYTLPWRTLSANYRAASDLIGVQAHVLHAGGRRGSSHTRVEESSVTRSRFTLSPLPGAEEPMISYGNGRRRHDEAYESADGYGSPLAVAATAVAAGERYVSTASGAGADPLRAHAGTGENLYLVWNDIPDGATALDVVVHIHGYADRAPDAGTTRYVAAKSGLRLAGRARPTLGIVPRGRKRTREEYDRLVAEWRPRHAAWDEAMAAWRAAPHGDPPREPRHPRSDVYTFPALESGNGAGLAALVEWAVAWFTANVLSGAPRPSIARCILTAHSGGGEPVNTLLQWKDQRPICNPHEVHLFDAVYGGHAAIRAWAQGRIAADRALVSGLAPADALTRLRAEGGGCRIFYRPRSDTQRGSLAIAAAFPPAGDALQPAYRAEATTYEHDDIPNTFGPTLLTDVRATMNLDRPRPASRGHALDSDGYSDSYVDDPAAQPAYGSVGEPAYGYGPPAYGYVAALAVDDDVRAWLAATAPTDRAPLAASVRAWIADTARSGIELIADAGRRRHFLSEVDWTRVDFPGNDADRSTEANALFNAIAAAVPERRVTGLRFHDVDSVVQSVPGEAAHVKLHPEARDAFVRMRDAARADGVELRIGSAWRSLAQQRAIAAKNPNPNAVAQRVSAHSYGLAVDLLASVPGLRIGEISTRPFTNIVALYRTPMYKWMALHAREHGFFPYRREPWHWEYNPTGFAERWDREAPAAAAHAHSYGAPLGLFERYPAGALDAAPVNRIAVPRLVDVRDRAVGLQAPAAATAPAVDWCRIRTDAAATARREERDWTAPNGRKLVEGDVGREAVLRRYWAAVPGVNAATAAHNSAVNDPDWPWSAAFICYVMQQAGVQRAHGFEFGAAHIRYIVGALRNRERSDTTRPFWLLDQVEVENEVTVQPGDLICLNRKVDGHLTRHSYSSLRTAFWGNNGANQNVRPWGSSHCTLVVGIGQDAQGRFVETIGGNENNSVRLGNYGRIALNAGGGIVSPASHNIFGLIKLTECRG